MNTNYNYNHNHNSYSYNNINNHNQNQNYISNHCFNHNHNQSQNQNQNNYYFDPIIQTNSYGSKFQNKNKYQIQSLSPLSSPPQQIGYTIDNRNNFDYPINSPAPLQQNYPQSYINNISNFQSYNTQNQNNVSNCNTNTQHQNNNNNYKYINEEYCNQFNNNMHLNSNTTSPEVIGYSNSINFNPSNNLFNLNHNSNLNQSNNQNQINKNQIKINDLLNNDYSTNNDYYINNESHNDDSTNNDNNNSTNNSLYNNYLNQNNNSLKITQYDPSKKSIRRSPTPKVDKSKVPLSSFDLPSSTVLSRKKRKYVRKNYKESDVVITIGSKVIPSNNTQQESKLKSHPIIFCNVTEPNEPSIYYRPKIHQQNSQLVSNKKFTSVPDLNTQNNMINHQISSFYY